jgi:quercetin dioxygenase-like cupin family protein
VQSWQVSEIEAPDGKRDPVVLETLDGARAVAIVLSAGQSLREHEVKERAWLAVLEGEAQIEAGGQLVEGGPGTLATFAPHERHSVSSETGARLLLLLSPWPGEGHYPE